MNGDTSPKGPPVPVAHVAEHDRMHPSIRLTLLEAMPEYAALLKEMTEMVQENNKEFARNILTGLHDIQVQRTLIPATASVSSYPFRTPFPVRHVIMRNESGKTLYVSGEPIGTAVSSPVASDIQFLSMSFAAVATGKSLSIPVHWNDETYFRFGDTVTIAATVYAVAYLYSQPLPYWAN